MRVLPMLRVLAVLDVDHRLRGVQPEQPTRLRHVVRQHQRHRAVPVARRRACSRAGTPCAAEPRASQPTPPTPRTRAARGGRGAPQRLVRAVGPDFVLEHVEVVEAVRLVARGARTARVGQREARRPLGEAVHVVCRKGRAESGLEPGDPPPCTCGAAAACSGARRLEGVRARACAGP